MTQFDTALTTAGRRKARIWVAALVGLLALVAWIGSGVGGASTVVGLAMVVVGAWALLRGRVGWAGIAGRRTAAGVAIGGLMIIGIGSALIPAPPEASTAAASLVTSPTTAARSSTAPATTRPARPPVAATPARTTTQAPTTPPAPVLPPPPSMAVTCPPGGSDASPVFGQQISAGDPYSVTIDYGDGDVYTNDDQHLAAVFSHTYAAAGAYTVQAVLTDAAGQTTSGGCTYSWTAPVVAPAPLVPGGVVGTGSSAGAGGGSSSAGGGGVFYQNCDAVRAAGAAPIYPGDPGFQQKFDRDNDGVGCE